MESFRRENGKGYTLYIKKNGYFYRQHWNYSEKLGMPVPSAQKRISEQEYNKAKGER